MNPVIAMLIGVVVMMVLVICTRMHAFPSLIISAILIAVLSGNYLLVGTGNEGGNLLSVAISTVTGGFGGTMTSICPYKQNQGQYRIILSADTASEVRQMLSQKRR